MNLLKGSSPSSVIDMLEPSLVPGGRLLVSGLATMAAIGYLLMLMRTGRFTATTLSLAVLPYVAFAVCLIPVLD